jgi:hypothetical protein
MLMAYPNATLPRLPKYGLDPLTVEQTDPLQDVARVLR